ncbi:DUF1642 domain-containing protein [Lacticaseibacillus paracasei]|jgi:frataxin-like iron-binding protein CyaY|uniref:Uncharacterized protein n=1 Tax=Lacticaseibacillus paracasei TaxID=1597 RepID=A0A422MC56_LACPA|nr:DUF1642 domain-containing protein [Lacticaseibacillus paracasei]RND86961.1 hypothetical protein FAM18172_01157 [Lacticaseibacillus paracasei]
MSEEKLYMVRNDEGDYWDFEDRDDFWELSSVHCPITAEEKDAKDVIRDYGGHVVTLIEVPEKVVISKTNALRQGWLVARYGRYNPDAVSDILARYKDEAWDMIEAYVNGYTVAKEKKYNVKVPHTKEVWYYKSGDTDLLTICPADKELRGKFTESEIEHYGLQDCEKEEVTDDGTK